MKQTEVDKILAHGSVKQKTNLYYLQGAYYVTTGEITILLTAEQEQEIRESIVADPKGLKYEQEIRIWSRAMLLYIERFTHVLNCLRGIKRTIEYSLERERRRLQTEKLVNDVLNLYPDASTRNKALELAAKDLKKDGAKIHKDRGGSPHLRMERRLLADIADELDKVDDLALDCKEYLVMFSYVALRKLPLKPYKEWARKQQKEVKEIVDYCIKFSKSLGYPYKPITPYNAIYVELHDEDVEGFYSAGI